MLARQAGPLGRPISYQKPYKALRNAPVRRQPLQVTAFRGPTRVGTSTFLRVPTLGLSYYDVLRIPPTATVEQIHEACQHLVGLPTKAAYSAETLFSRAVLLTSARERLMDPLHRQAYDQKLSLGDKTIRVTQADLPGALVLLQETGNYQSTIELATTWLEHFSNDPAVPDVAICLAEALCDRAAFAFEAWESKLHSSFDRPLLSACEDLSRAMDVCRRYDVAPSLLNDIATALKDYADKYALELLSLPLDAQHATRRLHGLEMLEARLKQPLPDSPEEAISHIAKVDSMVHEARYVLTAQEQLKLIPAFRSCPALQQGEAAAYVAWHAAFALVAAGYTQHLPHYIYRARQLFVEAQRRFQRVDSDLRDAEGPGAVVDSELPQGFMEQACCEILLGDTWAAHVTLGLEPGGSCREEQAAAFIRSRVSSDDDLAPGMRDMAQIWVRGAVLGFYREFQDSGDAAVLVEGGEGVQGCAVGTGLTEWYAHNTVWWYNKVYALLRFTPLLLTLHLVTRLLRHVTTWVQAATTPPPPPDAAAASPAPAASHSLSPSLHDSEAVIADSTTITTTTTTTTTSTTTITTDGNYPNHQLPPYHQQQHFIDMVSDAAPGGAVRAVRLSPSPATATSSHLTSTTLLPSQHRSPSPYVQHASTYTHSTTYITPGPSSPAATSPPPAPVRVTSRLAFSPGIFRANRASPPAAAAASPASGHAAPAAAYRPGAHAAAGGSSTTAKHVTGGSYTGSRRQSQAGAGGAGGGAVGQDTAHAAHLVAIPDAVHYFARNAKGTGIQRALAHLLCLVPFRRAVPMNEDVIATAGIDASEYELRRQLAQIERAAWDPPSRPDAAASSTRLLPQLLTLLLLAGLALAITTAINPQGLHWAVSLPALKALLPPALLAASASHGHSGAAAGGMA